MKNRNLSPIMAGLLLLCLAACSSQPSRPQWIDQPSADYPSSSHLTAVGSADDQQTAADRAIANLSKIFEVAVQEASQDFSSAFVISDGGEQRIENKLSVSREVTVQTDKVLQGAEVVEYWQSETGRYYALAILAKAPAAAGFSSSVMSADRELKNLVRYATVEANNPLLALKALHKAAAVQLHRDEQNRNLMVVKNGQGVTPPYDAAGIARLTREALATLQVQVDAKDESVRSELQQALAQLGIQVVAQSSLLLQGTMDLAPVSFNQGWFWQRGSYQLVFKDGQNVLAKQRYPMKVSAQDAAMVELRLKDKLNSSLSQYFYEMLSTGGN